MDGLGRMCSAGYDEGMLRTFLDGELSDVWSEAMRQHVGACAACSAQLGRLRLDSALVHGRVKLLQAPAPAGGSVLGEAAAILVADASRPPAAAILALARRQPAWSERLAPVGEWLRGWPGAARRPAPLLAGAAASAVLLIGVAFTQPAVQSFAQGVLQSFRVQKVQPVSLDAAILNSLPASGLENLFNAGTYTGPRNANIKQATIAQAASATGLTLRVPSKLPAQIKGAPAVYVSDAVNFSFTYDGPKLVKAAQDAGVKDASLLRQLQALHGLTVRGNIPAGAGVVYGDPGISVPAQSSPSAAQARATAERLRSQAPAQPALILAQLKSPSLDVPGSINVDQIREQALRSGALPPALTNQLLAIKDWKSTLPVPVVQGTSKEVTVDGVTGVLVDSEGPGLALIWQKDGVLYFMGGNVSETELLDTARSLAPAR